MDKLIMLSLDRNQSTILFLRLPREKMLLHIIKVGVNYHVAPLDIREKLTFSTPTIQEAMDILSRQEHIIENMILSTCNRTEIFAVVDHLKLGEQAIIHFLHTWFDISQAELIDYLDINSDEAAINHTFRLATGLESMVIGETQILGQFRDAFFSAQNLKVTGKIFNELFKRVITFAKRAHSNTAIGEHAVSIGYVAVERAKQFFDNMQDVHAVILGAGEMGALSLKHLHSSGVENITIVNRRFNKAYQLAEKFNATAVGMEDLYKVLENADILMSSTGANDSILKREDVSQLQKQRKNKPLFLIDIAVPRDIEPSVSEIDMIHLYDIDDLQGVADDNIQTRKAAAAIIASQIDHELASFQSWLRTLDVVPIIKALREKSICIQERTLASIFRKIPDLDKREMKVLRKHTQSIVNQILEQPIKQAKLIGESDCKKQEKNMFINIFGLEDSVENNK